MAFLSRKKRSRVVSPVQRLCGLCFALFVLFQTPLFTIPITYNHRVVDVPLSAVEVAAIGVLANYADYAPAMRLVLVPGAWWKLASKQLFFCLQRSSSCEPSRLVDGKALMQACEYMHMVDPFYEAAGSSAGMLAVASGMLLTSAIALPVVPNLPVSLVGLALFIWSIFQTACTPLPTIAFMGLLCVTAVFGPHQPQQPAGSNASSSAKAVAGNATGGSKSATQPRSVRGPVSNTPSPRKKRR